MSTDSKGNEGNTDDETATSTSTPSKKEIMDDITIAAKTKNQTFTAVLPYLLRANPSNIYYGSKRHKGKLYRESLGTTDRELAKRELKRFLEKVEASSPSNEGKIIFSTLAEDWVKGKKSRLKPASYVRCKGVVKMLNKYLGAIAVRNITHATITVWTSKRLNERSARTYNMEQTMLKSILDFAIQRAIISKNPLHGVKPAKGAKRKDHFPTKDEFKALIETMRNQKGGTNSSNLVEFLAYSGCRVNEAVSMTWGDIKEKSFIITGGKKGTKNHKVWSVPLFPALKALLERIEKSLPVKPQKTDEILQIKSAKKAITSSCKTAQLPYMHHHCFRHFFVTNALEANANFPTIAKWLGHSDGGALVARTYGHIRDTYSDDIAKGMTFGI